MIRTKVRTAMRYRFLAAVAAVLSTALAIVAPTEAFAAPESLTGTFYLSAGACSHGSASGSYIQMVLPSGSASGPYMANSDSSCSDQEYTLLSPGSEGGLRFGSYQPLPSPAFDSKGNAQAHNLTAPAQYEGTAFATSTNPVDPQTHVKVPAPSLKVNGSKVSADVRSFSVSWNKQYFNQGSPKPDGSTPGITAPATGTYDAKTGAMSLSWTSSIVGGPFDKFTGSWHFVGKFVPASGSGSNTNSGGGHSGGGATAPSTAASAGPDASASATPTAGEDGKNATAAPTDDATAVPVSAASQAAVTSVVSKHTWQVSWWLIVLAVLIAIAGFGALGALRRADGPDAGSGS